MTIDGFSIAGGLKVPWRPRLPGQGCLPGLFDETAEAGSGSLKQFGLTASKKSGEQDIELTILPRTQQHLLGDRIDGIRGLRRDVFSIRICR